MGPYFFDDDTYSISSDIDNITFDLGGYLKGVAVDGIIDILNSHNISNGFIDFGHSSVRAIGKCFDNSDWMLACKIDDEIKNIIVNDCSISTSGNETFERQHIINPKDGEYVKGVKIISVKSDTASHGEILSTVLCCLPEEKWDLILSAFNGKLLH
jgi:Membrane-associated lipoprotein involved in thiamine biosynthesis